MPDSAMILLATKFYGLRDERLSIRLWKRNMIRLDISIPRIMA